MLRNFTPSLAVSIAAMVVALGGAGYSATGGNFILGASNSADATTKLGSGVAGNTLQVANTSTAAGATALRLAVKPGKPPLKVNSSALVAGLNADLLDGLSANQLVRVGRGHNTEFGSGLTPPDVAKVKMQIPKPGFVLLTGVVTMLTSDSSCNPCYAHVFLMDKSNAEVSPVAVESIGNGTGNTQEHSVTVTWVFPVAESGARTFALQAGAGDSPVTTANPVITALYVPFGTKGTTELAGGNPQTFGQKQARLGPRRSDGTRAVLP